MEHRILVLKRATYTGNCVVYVMSRDQRVEDNHALLAAQAAALEAKLPLIVCFNLLEKTGVRSQEHFAFMVSGLREVVSTLHALNIPFVMTQGDPFISLSELFKDLEPHIVFFDFSPLHGPRTLAKRIAKQVKCPVFVVDTHNIVPAWYASQKLEFAAHTFRPKIHKLLETFLIEPDTIKTHPYTYDGKLTSISISHATNIISTLPKRDISITPQPGAAAARTHLTTFIARDLKQYALERNNPFKDTQSGLSPYLHFGHISSLRVALEVLYAVDEQPLLFTQAKMAQADAQPSIRDGMNALFEEMIVRKELSDNFCLYAQSYRTLENAPEWAKTTLRAHVDDPKEFVYSLDELEKGQTHDEAWNAAQLQMVRTGKMHGYMRMYWAKKILEWTADPETALSHTIYLNDAYSIDGGDPNGYVGILWSLAGLHDRPWTERPIYGKVRYMNQAGLRRKFELDKYISNWTP